MNVKKSRVIATCLVNSRMIARIEDAEHAVKQIFLEEFPAANFAQWDQDLDDRAAEHIIKTVGRASQINVKRFIEDLW
jgi:hypothetical protein